jgi:N-methylhydantoinase B
VSASRVDSFTAEIMRSALVSTVREMVATTTRTAYSTCFAHGEDFTCGLFDADARMIAQHQGVPVHAGALSDAVAASLEEAGTIEEGDVFLHNDPYRAGTHQADGLVCRPIFAEGELMGFAANRGHWTDVGGMAPGGWSGDAQDVIQEGLILSSIRLMRGGVVNEDVRRLLLRNVRLPVELWGDIQAQIASNMVAERRVRELVERYGLEGFQTAVDLCLSYSRRRFLAGLERVADGVAVTSGFLEDDGRGSGPLTIRVRVEKRAERVTVDFAGTDPQALAPVNSTLACTKAAAICALIAVVDPDIPLNNGVTDLIKVTAEPGTLVNPQHPAPTFGATADPCDRVAETVLRALAQLAPGRVPAGSYCTGNNVTGGGLDDQGRQFLWYSYQSGGCGARHGADGNSAEWHLMANSKNESMELWETRYPVEFVEYRLVPDSGGRGRWRGGLGTERRMRVLAHTRLSGISDHHRTGAHGIDGGGEGLPNAFALERDGTRRTLQEVFDLPSPSKFANLPLLPGDVFVTVNGGGGAVGAAGDRPAEKLAEDERAGYTSGECP